MSPGSYGSSANESQNVSKSCQISPDDNILFIDVESCNHIGTRGYCHQDKEWCGVAIIRT